MSVRENRHVYFCIIEGWRGVPDAFMLNTKGGKGMQSTYRREKIVRTEKEFDINGTKVMAYSRKDAIKRLKHKK